VSTAPVVARPRAAAAVDPHATTSNVARVGPWSGWRSPRPGRGRSQVGNAVEVRRSSDVLAADQRLCLEDHGAPGPAALSGPRGRGAWTRGLRG
jgi:hypothetical protein